MKKGQFEYTVAVCLIITGGLIALTYPEDEFAVNVAAYLAFIGLGLNLVGFYYEQPA